MPDEKLARRPDWIEGIPIKLEDDQVWHFPRPIIEFHLSLTSILPTEKSSEPVKGVARRDSNRKFGAEFWRAQEAIRDIVHAMDPEAPLTQHDFAQMLVSIAADLLRRNYNLTDEDLVVDLLSYRPFDQRNFDMWTEILSVLMGYGLKVEAAG